MEREREGGGRERGGGEARERERIVRDGERWREMGRVIERYRESERERERKSERDRKGKGKGMVLYSAVSSPLDRSKRFTL